MYKVGDVVLTKNKEQRKIVPAVVVKVDREWSVNVLFKDGELDGECRIKSNPQDTVSTSRASLIPFGNY